MNCNCNNENNKTAFIKHVFGNVLRVAIPLTLRNVVKDGDEIVVTDTDFIPSSDYPVNVVFLKGKKAYTLTAALDGNVATVEDDGNIAIGTYDIVVECRDNIGRHYRFKQNAVLRVVDATAEAGIEEEIEYEVKTWYLNAAVYLATTDIGSMSEEIDRKLEDVFGDVEYDEREQLIKFYNKDKTKVLARIDSRPFVVDGTVDNVYIDVSRQVLVVVLNADAGGRIFTVPLYLLFANYYNKTQVDALLSNIQVDTDGLPQLDANGRLRYNQAPVMILDHINGVEGEDVVYPTEPNMIFGAENGHIILVGDDDERIDLGITQYIAFYDKTTEAWYRYSYGSGLFDEMGWHQLSAGGGSGGGGITQETDPTVPSWAKQPTKPTYTPQEVGALPADTPIPTKTSDLVNDSGFLTQHQSLSGKQDVLVSGENIKTINGNSVLGAGDIDTNQIMYGKLVESPRSAFYPTISYNPVSREYTFSETAVTYMSGVIYVDVLTYKHYMLIGAVLKEIGGADLSNFADVAFSGSYDDLEDKPTIPAAQVNADWNASSGVAQILNKPTIPTVPTNVSAFTNDAGYLTSHQDISGKADKVTVVDVASTGDVSQLLAPNTFYKFGSIDSLALTLTAGTGFVMYAGKFTASADWGGTELSVPATVTEATGNDTVEAGKVYEFSILDNVISVKEVA